MEKHSSTISKLIQNTRFQVNVSDQAFTVDEGEAQPKSGVTSDLIL